MGASKRHRGRHESLNLGSERESTGLKNKVSVVSIHSVVGNGAQQSEPEKLKDLQGTYF